MSYPDNRINDELRRLYESQWSGYEDHIRTNNRATNPQLICVSDRYQQATHKIVVVGQETFSWFDREHNPSTHPSVTQLMSIYDKFVNLNRGKNSPYWNFIRRIMSTTTEAEVAVTNIIKIGKRHGSGYDHDVKELTKRHFNVIKDELEILHPDIIIFTTGPNYDPVIRQFLGSMTTSEISNKVYKISFDNNIAECSAYRIHHPAYLVRQRLYHPTAQFFSQILSSINQEEYPRKN